MTFTFLLIFNWKNYSQFIPATIQLIFMQNSGETSFSTGMNPPPTPPTPNKNTPNKIHRFRSRLGARIHSGKFLSRSSARPPFLSDRFRLISINAVVFHGGEIKQ
jgi:hypothetical protein